MALKALIARKKIESANTQLALLQKQSDELKKRESELAASAEEITSETSQDDIAALDAEVAAFEAERDANKLAIENLRNEIKAQEEIIRNDESATEQAARAASAAMATDAHEARHESREEGGQAMPRFDTTMRARRFRDLPYETRQALFGRSETHTLAEDFRSLIRGNGSGITNRATGSTLTGVAFTIPTVYADTLSELTYGNSALLPLVDNGRVSGIEKQNIRIGKNEAVWMEQCKDIGNYVDKEWKQISLDVHQVAALADVCGAVAEDSDENLVALLMDELASAIAFAEDKAIIYGRGSGMPLGIVTNLAYEAKPANWPVNGLGWKDLHTSNIVKLNIHGKELFSELTKLKRKLNKKFGRSDITWVMNENTRDDLMLELAGFDSSYALVSSLGDTMPLAGGKIAVVDGDLLPDGDILLGRFGLYRFALRGGQPIVDVSDQVKWYSGTKVIKHVDRADGRPVVADAFLLVNIADTDPRKTVAFAGD